MRIAIILIASAALLLGAGCKRDGKSASSSTQSTPAPAVAAVMHYICPNNCAGSGGDGPGACPVCGTEYQHNDAYHNQPGQQPTPPQPTLSGPQNPEFQQSPVVTPPAPTDPPQNAAGVWHYICSNGCAGGSGAAGNCSKCGSALAHNAAYHQ